MKTAKNTPFLPIAVGDVLRDCDPRTSHKRRRRTVLEVCSTEVVLKGDYPGAIATRVSRLRIHDKPVRRTGYYLLPKG